MTALSKTVVILFILFKSWVISSMQGKTFNLRNISRKIKYFEVLEQY